MVSEPTRSGNWLDLILSSDHSFLENLTVGEPFGSSDHQVVRFNLVVAKEAMHEKLPLFNYFKADYYDIRNYVNSNTLDVIDQNVCVQNNWLVLKNKLNFIRDMFVPKLAPSNRKCKWVTRKVVRCRKAKKKAWNNYVKSGRNSLLYDVYVAKLRESVKINNKAKQDFNGVSM